MTTIAARLAVIETRIREACERSGRARREINLVGASKRQPVSALLAAHQAGLDIFGENRVQEARDKRGALPSSATRWHLLGPLQSNKVALATPLFETFHAIDREKIARALDREAQRLELHREGFLEVNLGNEATKHGFSTESVVASLVALRGQLSAVNLVGLMAIPPQETTTEATRQWFRRLRALRDEARGQDPAFPGQLSMGMSGDFEIAIEEGATHIRVGTLLFGERPPAGT